VPNAKPSRLELYIEILSSLEQLRQSNFITIQEKTKVEQAFLKHAMTFLENQNLVRKGKVDDETVYMTTERGDRVSRYFMGNTEQIQPNPMKNFV
jgi:predicted transcriptional regulator